MPPVALRQMSAGSSTITNLNRWWGGASDLRVSCREAMGRGLGRCSNLSARWSDRFAWLLPITDTAVAGGTFDADREGAGGRKVEGFEVDFREATIEPDRFRGH